MNKRNGLLLFAAFLGSACGTPPQKSESRSSPAPVVEAQSAAVTAPSGSGGYLPGDGPGTDVPANLDAIPDAIPRAEPIHRYANRPYDALGKTYTPLTTLGNYKERGTASWYGKKFNGRRTSVGEVYDMYGMTAAHPTLPIPSYARITNLSNKKSVVVRVNDRGPFLHDRIIDLSYTAAYKLGILRVGSGQVEVESLAPDAWPVPVTGAESVHTEPLPSEPAPVTANAPADPGGVYLQLGAFKSRLGAESFLARMRTEFEGGDKQVVLYSKDDLTRVHLGPYSSQEEAHAMAGKLHARLGFKPIVSLH